MLLRLYGIWMQCAYNELQNSPQCVVTIPISSLPNRYAFDIFIYPPFKSSTSKE